MARRSRQTVPEGRTAALSDFDEQRWPVNLAILVLAGFVVGIIVTQGNFDVARTGVLDNGYVQLGLVGLLVILLLVAVNRLRTKVVRRVQLCILFSLLVHLWLGMYLHAKYLAIAAMREAEERQIRQLTVPDYLMHHPERPRGVQSFERPVETDLPDAIEPEPIEPEAIQEESQVQRPTPAEPETVAPDEPDPMAIDLAKLEPLLREELARARQIDRRESTRRFEREEVLPMPKIEPADSRPPPTPQVRSVELAHRQAAPTVQPRRTVVPPEGPAGPEDPRTAARRVSRWQSPPDLSAEPGALARASAPIPALSGARMVENVPAPAPVEDLPAGRLEVASSAAAVRRSDEASVRRPPAVSADALPFVVGPSPLVARAGPPRAGGSDLPSLDPGAAWEQIGRASAGTLIPTPPSVRIPDLAPGIPAGSIAAGPPLEVRPGGQARRMVGLAATLPSRPRGQLLAGLDRQGPPRMATLGRRAAASEQMPGLIGAGPGESPSLGRASTGPRLLAAVVPLQKIPTAGAPVAPAGQRGWPGAPGGKPSGTSPTDHLAAARSGRGLDGLPTVERAQDDRLAAHGLGRGTLEAGGAGGWNPGSTAGPGLPRRREGPIGEMAGPLGPLSLTRRTSGRADLDGRVREPPAEAFRQRAPGRRSDLGRRHGATEAGEEAVERGLDFLARHQFPDGRWSLDQLPHADRPEYAAAGLGQMRADTAATGLAVLAFLGAGYTHMEHKHRAVVRQGIDWLLANQQSNGQLFTVETDTDRAGRIYGHGIAAIALCEAYGMTGDPRLRGPAQRAIQFIIDAQHPTWGGWRYTKKDDAAAWRKESDTSVSGWQLMALKSAQMAGLEVPGEVMRKVGRWLDLAQADGGARYVYNPYAANTPQQRQGRFPNLAMTAEGLLMRMYLGWDRNHPAMIRGADYLKENLPGMDASGRSERDVYYWYYATQVMFQMHGDHWAAWNGRLRPGLVNSQVKQGPLAGSWDPNRPARDHWAHAGGRLYVTTMNLLMLEVYYRYLPLFDILGGDVQGSGR